MRSLPALLLTAASLAACGGEPAPAARPPSAAGPAAMPLLFGSPAAPAAGSDAKADDGTRGSVRISDAIVKACGAVPTASFDFDSSAVSTSAQTAFVALARCFTSGPLTGRSVRLVGHTDNRGEVNYNIGLGQRRAGSVGNLLRGAGLPTGRIVESSAGEFEATGEDEAGWARDRRVDVALAD